MNIFKATTELMVITTLLTACGINREKPVYNPPAAQVRLYHATVGNADKRLCREWAKTQATAQVVHDAYAQMNLPEPADNSFSFIQGVFIDEEEITPLPKGYRCYCRIGIERAYFDALQATAIEKHALSQKKKGNQ